MKIKAELYFNIVIGISELEWDGVSTPVRAKTKRLQKFVNFFSVFQNDSAFLGRIGTASLSEFFEIYGEAVPFDLISSSMTA
jgi:hypothetical protein